MVRIELTRHYVPRREIAELEESGEADMQIQIEGSDYQRLRESQNLMIQKSLQRADRLGRKQIPTTMLAQQSSGEVETAKENEAAKAD